MKNVRPDQLKTAIFLTQKELEVVLSEVLQKTVTANISPYGLGVGTEDEVVDDCGLCDALSKHFDVRVTSVHIDDYDYVGVWIIYKDKEVG